MSAISNQTSTDLLESLIFPDYLAQKLGLTERALADWRAKGTGPKFIRLGGRRVAYRPEDVDSWLLSQVRASTLEERS